MVDGIIPTWNMIGATGYGSFKNFVDSYGLDE